MSEDSITDDFGVKVTISEPADEKPKKKVTHSTHATNPNAMIRVKSSSTSTLFIADTISKPDVEECLRCLAKHMLSIITKGAATCEKVYFNVFNEMVHPITKSEVNFYKLPSEQAVFGFIKFIYVYERMDPECIIMCLTYIERLIAYTKMTVDISNWRRIVLASWIVALKSKYSWEELAVYNLDFLGCFDGQVTVQDLNIYNVYLSSSDYTKKYFDLKSHSSLIGDRFPLKPLTNERGNLLENRSQSSQALAKAKVKKSASVDTLKPTTCFVPAVIN